MALSLGRPLRDQLWPECGRFPRGGRRTATHQQRHTHPPHSRNTRHRKHARTGAARRTLSTECSAGA
eukprot:15432910-Alexandrium_andersonii.AAC.1